MSSSAPQIVICHRRWIFVGYVSAEEGTMGREIVVRSARVLRRWGTSLGLGELYGGPKPNTILDPAGVVRLHPMQVIGRLELDEKAWKDTLGA